MATGTTAGGGGSFATPLDDTNALMYASRMQYLHDDESKDRTRPDTQFMSRKQAHKQGAYSATGKTLDHHHGHHGHHYNRRMSIKQQPSPHHDVEANWQPVFQAGCHFWQNVVTGECIADEAMGCSPCPFHEPEVHCEWNGEVDEQDGDVTPFPPSFQFLDAATAPKAAKNKSINKSVHHIVMRKSER
ncbi:hypothetical protein, variant [Aphanomyces invadans]|uniref:Uncharacterized protein n=1 Tax=Aphanomyces invadans TaxID=157072 RepID=A0A024UF58_9STRA|nr:hypothetical protein, variant [Aphanomyces invadans]ETW04278.1 hypothetical protein, variant [Aphanomyces invadans]|eukprot:XP_008867234.1 hypothetical protein, variant [Aphanomyces invadans]